jgi:hypothetical protein
MSYILAPNKEMPTPLPRPMRTLVGASAAAKGPLPPWRMVSVCGIRGNVLGNMLGYKDLALDGS